jgi:transposase
MGSEVFAFVDWGVEEVEVGCLTEVDGSPIRARFERTGEGLQKLVGFLKEASQGRITDVHVAIERTCGAVVDVLIQGGFHTYAINPKQTGGFRRRHRNSRARDDRFDCFVGARALRSDRDCFRLLNSPNPLNEELRSWQRSHHRLTKQKTRTEAQLREQLLVYYPQVLELGGLNLSWVQRVWAAIPTPQAAARATKRTIAKAMGSCRRFTAEQVLVTLKQTPLTVCEGAARAARGRAELLFETLQLLARQLKQVHKHLQRLVREIDAEHRAAHPNTLSDALIVRSLPGAGIGLQAAMIGEVPELLRHRDHQTVRAICGVAPVTDASGKQQNRFRKRTEPKIMMRRACNLRLRDAMHHLARNAVLVDPYYKKMYARMRSKGHTHGRTCRQVADNMLTLLFAMLRNGTTYDPAQREQRHSATLAAA